LYLSRALLMLFFIYGQTAIACRIVCDPDEPSSKSPSVLILCGLDHDELFSLIVDQDSVATGLSCLTDKTDRLLVNCKTEDPDVWPQASVIFYRTIRETIGKTDSALSKKIIQKKLKVVFSQTFEADPKKPKVKSFEYNQNLSECQSASDR